MTDHEENNQTGRGIVNRQIQNRGTANRGVMRSGNNSNVTCPVAQALGNPQRTPVGSASSQPQAIIPSLERPELLLIKLPKIPEMVNDCQKELGLPRKYPAISDAERNGLWMRIWIDRNFNLENALREEQDNFIEKLKNFVSAEHVRIKEAIEHILSLSLSDKWDTWKTAFLEIQAAIEEVRKKNELSLEHRRHERLLLGRKIVSQDIPAEAEERLLGASKGRRLRPRTIPKVVEDKGLQSLLDQHWARVLAVQGLFKDYTALTEREFSELNAGVQNSLKGESVVPIKYLKKGIESHEKCGFTKRRQPDAKGYYAWLRHFYWQRFHAKDKFFSPWLEGLNLGITSKRRTEPVDWIKELNRIKFDDVVLFDVIHVNGGVHDDFKIILDNANNIFKKLKDMTHINGIKVDTKPMIKEMLRHLPKRVDSFVPRPLQNCRNLSPHAIGKAFDYDPARNPHLIADKQRAIDMLLVEIGRTKERVREPLQKQMSKERAERFYKSGSNLASVLQAAELIQKINEISVGVKSFLNSYMDKIKNAEKPSKDQSQKLGSELSAEKHRQLTISWLRKAFNDRDLGIMRDKGIFNVPSLFFVIMKMAKAHSGIEFETAKDSMHFEVFNWDNQLILPGNYGHRVK